MLVFMKTKMMFPVLAGCVVALVITGMWFAFIRTSTPAFPELESGLETTFFKSFSCGCCGLHASYLKSKGGLDVKVVDMADVSVKKRELNIPASMQSCHTAVIGNYFVEGHIPLEAVEKLMAEKPDIAGIAMPGMPSGSPGMTGGKTGPFIIYAVNKDGSTYTFVTL